MKKKENTSVTGGREMSQEPKRFFLSEDAGQTLVIKSMSDRQRCIPGKWKGLKLLKSVEQKVTHQVVDTQWYLSRQQKAAASKICLSLRSAVTNKEGPEMT